MGVQRRLFLSSAAADSAKLDRLKKHNKIKHVDYLGGRTALHHVYQLAA